MPVSTHHQVLIVGGGTAGITVSAILKRRAVGINLAIVEPEHDHYYQPAFTLVGAGVYQQEDAKSDDQETGADLDLLLPFNDGDQQRKGKDHYQHCQQMTEC